MTENFMYILSSLLFAFSVNIDAFLVGLSYGVRRMHIPLFQNLLISLISFAGTFFSLFLGRQLLPLLPPLLADLAGSGILAGLGLFYIVKSIPARKNELDAQELHVALPLRETLLLGVALSLNNIGIGIGASLSGTTLLPTALATFLLSALLLPAGNYLGGASRFCLSARRADLVSGIMLLVLGGCNFLL